MANGDFIAHVDDLFRRFLQQKRHQRRIYLPFFQHEIFKLLSISHPPDTVMFLHQLVAGADVRGGHLFLRGKLVFYDFKHPVEARQRKHQHHHAANTRRFNKLFIGVGDVVQVFTIAFGFGVLLTANRHIQLGGGFARQNFAQPFHQSRRQRRVNHKVGAGKTEDDAGLNRGGQAGIDEQLPFFGAVNGYEKRQRAGRHDELAD